ncbi:hypothetical protein [Bradyrhizobium sp.]|uniref:hypothetical protein n=1 Tax=Bradyrhizobium sp. TaxID=376 RepID=UPI0040379B6F
MFADWTVQIDRAARKLTIVKHWKLPWTNIVLRKTIVNYCTFDECDALGTASYGDSDSYPTFGVYLDFRGGREFIPVGLLSDASNLAGELSAIAGIPRQDIQSYPFWKLWGRSKD